jgi:formylmethanofuran dehydrogenase subunit E
MTRKIDHDAASAIMIKAGAKPIEQYPGAKVAWLCQCMKCNREISPNLSNVKNGHSPCGYCAGKKVDIAEAYEIFLKAGVEPLEPYKNSHSGWKSQCLKCDRIVKPRYSTVSKGQSACVYCAGRKNDPEEVASQALTLGFKLKSEYKGTDALLLVEHIQCGKTLESSFHRLKSGIGCKHCSKKYVEPEEARLFMLASGLVPIEPYSNALSKWKCLCESCGKEVSPRYADVTQGKRGCIECGNKRSGLKRRVSEAEAIAVMIEAQLEPIDPYVLSHDPWKCKCLKCGEIVFPTFHNVQSGSGGCAYCQNFGIKYGEPTYLYLLTNSNLRSHKVGITNITKSKNSDRLGKFVEREWEIVKLWTFETGAQARDVEAKVLNHIRKNLNFPAYLSKAEMGPLGGHTETIGAESISLLDLEKLIVQIIL